MKILTKNEWSEIEDKIKRCIATPYIRPRTKELKLEYGYCIVSAHNEVAIKLPLEPIINDFILPERIDEPVNAFYIYNFKLFHLLVSIFLED